MTTPNRTLSRPGYDMPCPRGLVGGAAQHQRLMLVHRLVDGRLVCMTLDLAIELDEAVRDGRII